MSKAKLIIIVSLIVIVVMLFLDFRRGRRTLEFETAVVESGNITTSIFASGEIKSAAQADVFAKTSGPVFSLPVKDGQKVQKGQLLLQLDATSAQATVASKELALQIALQKRRDLEDSAYTQTDLEAAEALVNERRTAWVHAEEDYNEDKTDEARKAIRDAAYTAYLQAEEALENLRNSNPTNEDWAAIEAEIESARKALEDAKLNLSHTTINAPQAGTLIFVDSGNGNVSKNSVISSGQKLFIIADLSFFIFEAEVDESEIEKIEIGQKVRVTLDAYSGTEFEGKVSEVAKTTILDSSGNKVVEVEVDLNLKGLETLRLGLSGDAEIIFEEKENVLFVPLDAVSFENGKNYVYIIRNEKYIKREVRLGLENGDTVEVVSGLSEGEKVDVNPSAKPD